VHARDAEPIQMAAQLVPPAVDERADDPAFLRVHPAEAARTRPANQPQQKRFGLIVTRMTERYDVGADALADRLKKLVARRMPRVFDGAPLFTGAGCNIRPPGVERPTQTGCDAGAERLVGIRRRPELVVQVSGSHDAHKAAKAQLREEVRKRDGVRPA
jgi:hypothetical protein